MAMLDELRAAGSAARQLPGVLCRRTCEGRHDVAPGNVRSPVVLVHGYGGTEAVWAPLRRALREAGFGHLVSLNYNSFAADPAAVVAALETSTRRVLVASSSARVHLIGHSLGGLILRHAINRSGLAPLANTVVTIATPHRGSALARFAPGRCSWMMRRHAVLPSPLESPPPHVRWLAYYSDRDRVVLPDSARLTHPSYRATNVLIPGCGHLTICRDARLIRSLVNELARADQPWAPSIRMDAADRYIAA